MSDECDRSVVGVVGVFGDSMTHTEDPSENHRFSKANNHTHSSSESPNPVQQHSPARQFRPTSRCTSSRRES